MTVHLEHDAELEMLEAARHYEEQQSGLGSDFLDEVELASSPNKELYVNS